MKGINVEVAARSCLMAGVALVGAGAIAAAPIQPVLPDVQVPAVQTATTPVELNALVNPLQLWAEVVGTAVGNAGTLADTFLANPAPILGNIVNNQLITASVLTSFATTFGEGFINGVGDVPAAVQSAVEQILAGDIQSGVTGLATAFLTPVLLGGLGALQQLPDVTAVLQNPFLNAASVVGTVVSLDTLLGLGFPLLIETIAPVAQIGVTGQAIFDGLQAGDFEAVANAIISFPSDLANTILNGSDSEFIGNNGLLGEGGLIDSLLTLRQSIADAIDPPPVSSAPLVSEAPDLQAESITVSTDQLDASVPSADAEQPEGSESGSGADDEAATVATVSDEDVAVTEPQEATDEDETPTGDETVVVNAGNKVEPTTLAGDKATRPGQRAAAALQSFGDEIGKSVKRFGDDVKKALGVKPKADTSDSTPSGDSEE